jgi:hypothetical protein
MPGLSLNEYRQIPQIHKFRQTCQVSHWIAKHITKCLISITQSAVPIWQTDKLLRRSEMDIPCMNCHRIQWTARTTATNTVDSASVCVTTVKALRFLNDILKGGKYYIRKIRESCSWLLIHNNYRLGCTFSIGNYVNDTSNQLWGKNRVVIKKNKFSFTQVI